MNLDVDVDHSPHRSVTKVVFKYLLTAATTKASQSQVGIYWEMQCVHTVTARNITRKHAYLNMTHKIIKMFLCCVLSTLGYSASRFSSTRDRSEARLFIDYLIATANRSRIYIASCVCRACCGLSCEPCSANNKYSSAWNCENYFTLITIICTVLFRGKSMVVAII